MILIFILIVVITLRLTFKPIKNDPMSNPLSSYKTTDNLIGFANSNDNELKEEEQEICHPIHLAIVCGGFNSTKDFYVLLKSILFYRTTAIQLHLFVDNISSTILRELFRTWTIPDLTVSYYNLTSHEEEVAWIPSQHYSHRYGLMKLVFLSLLADRQGPQIKSIIMIDTDMITMGNINRAWLALDLMRGSNPEAVFGLVENQSDWYVRSAQPQAYRVVWPAIGRGFNTGLILADLDRLRAINWAQLWRTVAETELISRLTAPLVDQDIINAVMRLHPQLVYTLPCRYNLQLNDHSKLDSICPDDGDDEKFTFIHWNSPNKLETTNSKGTYYKNWHLTFMSWDGKLLERGACETIKPVAEPEELNQESIMEQSEYLCQDIQPRPNERLRTLLYFMELELEKLDDTDVTIILHLSLDRLRVLDELAKHWPGPISVAIYLPEQELNLLLQSIRDSENLARRRNIGYHLVFKDHGFNYPINRLRNIALRNALTPFVFLSDIDFIPASSLYSYLKETIGEMMEAEGNHVMERRALVVPAFENLQYKLEFPTSKQELETQLNLGSVSMFRSQIWPQGHAPTDYDRWRISTKPYEVDWRLDYEPFIVTTKEVPKFDERFVGFGWNKVEHIMELAALDYKFLVLPEAFVIHQFHAASYDIIKHRESSKYRTCIKGLKRSFLLELKARRPDFFTRIIGATGRTSDTGSASDT